MMSMGVDQGMNPKIRQKVAENLSKAGNWWNITKADFALKNPTVDTPAVPIFTLKVAEQVPEIECFNDDDFKQVAQHLDDNANTLPSDIRKEAARAVLKFDGGKILSADIRASLEKTAGYAVAGRAEVIRVLDVLSEGLRDVHLPKEAEVLHGYGSNLNPVVSGPELAKVAELADGVRRGLAGLGKTYAKQMPVFEKSAGLVSRSELQKASEKFFVIPGSRSVEMTHEAEDRLCGVLSMSLGKEASRETIREELTKLTPEEEALFVETGVRTGLYA
jgi:hypothetical protein